MDVSVIIVNYNTLKMTQECINSVFEKTTGLEYEVILVDNASTDGSKECFEGDERIKYVYSDKNLGFGRANNLGYKYAEGNYVFLLNSDTLLINNAILEMYNYMVMAPSNVACVGCELVDENNVPNGSYGKFPDYKVFLGRILIDYKIHSKFLLGELKCTPQYPMMVDYVCGADLFIRRNVIDRCGFFDPDFFMYFEETELQYRFNQAGYQSQIINTPKIRHLKGASGASSSKRMEMKSLRTRRIELESRFIYCTKVFDELKRKKIALMHLILMPKILLFPALWWEKKCMMKIICENCK